MSFTYASAIPVHWIVSHISRMLAGVTRTLVVLVMLVACGKAPSGQPAQIIDLSTSVAELRRDFDAHRGEARFVALLSPT